MLCIQSNTREAHYIGSIYMQVNRMLSLEETQCSESLNLQPYLLPLLLFPSSPPPSIFWVKSILWLSWRALTVESQVAAENTRQDSDRQKIENQTIVSLMPKIRTGFSDERFENEFSHWTKVFGTGYRRVLWVLWCCGAGWSCGVWVEVGFDKRLKKLTSGGRRTS